MLGSDDLGSASVAQDLIPGSVDQLDATIEALVSVGVPANEVGDTLPKLDAEDWTGPAADAFRTVFAPQPDLWIYLGTGLTEMSDALKAWRDAVQHGQSEAWLAKQEWDEAQAMTAASQAAYLGQVEAHNQATSDAFMANGPLPAPLPPFDDLGASLRQQAQQRLAEARAAVTAAESEAVRALGAAREALPQSPTALQRFGDDLSDEGTTVGTQLADVGKGAVGAVSSMVDTVRAVNPLDPAHLNNPGQYAMTMLSMGRGVAHAVEHPIDTLQSMADNAAEEIQHDPGRFIGALLPNVAVGLATDGAGEVATEVTETAAAGAEEATGAARAVGVAPDVVDSAAGDAASTAPVPHSTAGVPSWGSWNFGPTGVDTAAGGIEAAGAGLGQVERDLAGVHVAGELPSPSGTSPEAGPSTGAATADRPVGAVSGRPAASSTSVSTPWGTFGGWDARGADAGVAVQVEAAGAGLGQVERDLAGIHLHLDAGGDPSFSGSLLPGYVNPEYRVGDLARQAYQAKWPNTVEDTAWLGTIRREWPAAGGLFDQELLALERFTSPEGPVINAALRTSDDAALSEMDPEIRNLVSALNKLPNYRGPVVRSAEVQPADWGSFLREYEPGATVRGRGFTIASQDGPQRGNVRVHINSTGGKDISPVVPGRNQVVFPDNEAFKVVSREFDPIARIWNIYLDDVGR